LPDLSIEILDELGACGGDPLRFVMFAFPWGEPHTQLADRAGPEPWQLAVLEDLRTGLLTPEQAIRVATVSGNGVGKSALVAWIILWAFSTFEDTRGVVTANTEGQLKTKTWAELGKWFYMFIGRAMFSLTATALFAKERERTWRVDMVPWSENNVAAFQGLHNEGKRLFMLFDEASGIADVIWEAADGCMTDANTERLWMVCGNPNHPIGRFRDCFPGGKQAWRWRSHKVDSRDVSFTDKAEFEAWAKAEGEDSDFFRVRVKGEFPRVGFNSFISPAVVAEARARDVMVHRDEPLILGVDVARFGDDASVVFFRKGRDARGMQPAVFRGLDTMQLAARVAEFAASYRPDGIFVDGGGVGGGVIDRLRQLRVHCIEVQFGAKPDRLQLEADASLCANKRAEIWSAMREWLKGGAIPDDDQLDAELCAPMYGYNAQNAILLEAKEAMRKRGVPSPDMADALALTFAYPVSRSPDAGGPYPAPEVVSEYNPLEMAF
jgi:hypothetical protein